MKKNPLPNEHAARQKPPELFKTFRRSKSFRNKPLPPGISVIYGIRKEKGPRGGSTEIQSFRFDKNKWGVKEAKKWLKDNGFETKIERATKRKQQRRKNPYYQTIGFFDLIKKAILSGEPETLTRAIVYGAQGYECNDCGKTFSECECEKCDDCGYNRCLCDLEILNRSVRRLIYSISKEDQSKVRNKAWKIAKHTLSENRLEQLKFDILEKINDVPITPLILELRKLVNS